METPKEYYYTYYSYEEWGRGYFGSRGCKCLPEEDINYLGSSKDKTFKPKYKIILKGDYATREEAYADEIILQQYYKVVENPHFTNKAYQTSTKFYVSHENSLINGKIGGKVGGKIGGTKCKELKLGFFSLTPEKRTKNSIKGGKIGGKIGGKKCKELGLGIHGRTKEQIKKHNSKAGKIGGIKGAKSQHKQRWKCLVTGFISTPCGLSSYQKARGIDKSMRIRLE
jgi:hypothetical protein